MIPILLGLFGALFYVGNSEVRRFENLAANDIKSRLEGPARRVRVRTQLNGLIGGPLGDLKSVTIEASQFATSGLPLFTEPKLSQKGQIRKLDIKLRDFSLGKLHVQKLEAKIPECRYDYTLALTKRKIRLSRSGVGSGFVEISEDDLEKFILSKFQEVKQVAVQLENDRVLVKGYGEFIIIKSNFEVDAKLESLDGTKFLLTDAHIKFNGVPADTASANALIDAMSPVVDLDRDLKLYGAVRVNRITTAKGILRASGEATIPVNPATSSGPLPNLLPQFKLCHRM